MLINDYNFKSENIIYLQDSSATKNAISSAFDTIAAQITSNDVFYFYYSGHGGFGNQVGPFTTLIESDHPYDPGENEVWSISFPGADYMRVYFSRVDLEYGYDFLLCGDADVVDDYYYELYSGNYGYNFWSAWIPVDRYYLRLISDGSIQRYGFQITQYEAMMEDGTHYICSYDSIPDSPSNQYVDDLLDSKLDALNCAEKYVMIDSCHSGGMIPETQGSGRYIMSAADDDESSLEDPTLQNGIFTYYLLDSLDGAPDSNGDGAISLEEQYSYIYSNTVSYSTSQGYTHHPQQSDGISGESILLTTFSNLSISNSSNELTYSFNLHGVGEIENLTLITAHVNSTDIIIQNENLLLDAITPTGFESYSGTSILAGVENITSYGLYANVQGNTLITLSDVVSNDFDNDTVDDITEIFLGLDARCNDSDSDGLDDGFEYYGDTNPLLNDTDGDGLSDGDEYLVYDTSGINNDTDGDGLDDGFEILVLSLNATNSDSDGDSMLDGYEFYNDLNYTIDDAGLDHDSDGLSNLLESQLGTYANDSDCDDDSMLDGYEYYNDLNILMDDAGLDHDSDGLSNLLESQLGCYANNSDSDGDQLSDGQEVNVYNTDVLNPDTDGDGYSDGLEVQWGSDPLNPKFSLISIYLNFIGIAILAMVGTYAIRASIVLSKKKEKKKKESIKRLKFKGEIDSYNSLKVEEITKPQPKTSSYYSPYRQSYRTPVYTTGQAQPVTNEQMKSYILNFLKSNIPPPYPANSIQGKKAMIVAKASLQFIAQRKFAESFEAMLMALRLGVPEPTNSEIKSLLLEMIGEKPGTIQATSLPITKKCNICGNLNDHKHKFCTRCGGPI